MAGLVVVTGGTKGIGRAVLEKFASNGYDVCTCARKEAELESLAVDFGKKFKVKVYHRVADLSSVRDTKGFVEFVGQLGRPVDVLVNNAGFFVGGTVTEEPEGTLESMMGANLYSAYYTTRGLAPGMKQRKSGHIFNMCSIASFTAYPNGGSYAITKFALLGFSKVLREELKVHGVRVTAIMPGATRTASWDGTDLPDERFMKAEDVADTIYGAYVLSRQSVVEEIVIRPMLGDI
jgi:short-subunit dehydrogenase